MRPSLPSYPTISGAVAAVPAGSTVLVCPGTYNEQVQITQALTLQGVANGDSGQAVIAPPGGGLATNAADAIADSLAVQLWVDNASGPVNLSNLTVDGTGNGVSTCQPFIVGILYQNSSGIVNEVTVRNEMTNGCGVGIRLEGGANANPPVTIQNSSIHDVDFAGIFTFGTSINPFAVTIKGNYISASNSGIGIDLSASSTSTMVFLSYMYFLKPKLGASSRKHCRHRYMSYLRMTGPYCPHRRQGRLPLPNFLTFFGLTFASGLCLRYLDREFLG